MLYLIFNFPLTLWKTLKAAINQGALCHKAKSLAKIQVPSTTTFNIPKKVWKECRGRERAVVETYMMCYRPPELKFLLFRKG